MTEHAILVFARYRRFRVKHPDGTDVQVSYDGSFSPDDYIGKGWLQAQPGGGSVFTEWRKEASATEERGWQAVWFGAGGEQTLQFPSLASRFGVPAEAMVSALNRYSAEGWRLVNVSEDRGVYRGADTFDEAYVSRIRYLLTRG